MEESTKNIKPKTGDYLYCIEDIIKKSGPEKGLKSFIAGHYYKIWFSEEHINIVESELGRDANFYTESIPKYFIVIPGEDYEKHQNFDPFNLNESEIDEFDWVRDIKLELGFDDLQIDDIVKLKDYDDRTWMVIDIYMTDPNMTGGRPSEKRIKFRSVHRNGSSNF